MPTTTTTHVCAAVVSSRYIEGVVATNYLCAEPARWICVKDRARYCDEHAHVHACCQLVEIGSRPEPVEGAPA